MVARYDEIGLTYTATRRADPRIAARLERAIGEGASVVNVGAGAGAYEPPGTVLAVEPSPTMIAQRPPGAAPAAQAPAEAIPLPDAAVDVALAVLTIHHWRDLELGFRELRRVAARQVVLTWDPVFAEAFWLVAEYLPESVAIDAERMPSIERVVELLGGAASVEAVPVPADCHDGFFCAFWRRPHAYLDPVVRAGMSNLALLGEATLPGLARLADDLESGAWHARHADLLQLDELDLGYRIVASARPHA
jgi:SAM-dependent methyltransferase